MTNEPRPVKVIYIAGLGRSGSTLLDRILGATPGLFSMGEIRTFWRNWSDIPRAGRQSDAEPKLYMCGCGAHMSECQLWRAVVKHGFGETLPDAKEHIRVQHVAVSRRNIPIWFMRPFRRAGAEEKQRAYAADVERLFRGASAVGGAVALIDSSKIPRHALVLGLSSAFDLRVIHLVRDPRGSTLSWRRGATGPDSPAPSHHMRRVAAHRVAGMWVVSHLTTELLRLKGHPVLRVRYEEFVRDPVAWTDRILAFAGVEARPAGLTNSSFEAAAQHLVSGNPIRSVTGTIAIRPDNAWRRELPFKQKAIVTAMTWPMLLWYGLPLWPRRR